ncbi:MAG: TetR family transcriptional regulator [Actinomycetota bacterium]|nr:TetR family transcriptional regulator [Actinomycetota bacterium]
MGTALQGIEPAGEDGRDELREVLLDAAARVVARRGYDGTRIADVVKEAGLSTGAVYGRFRSKHELVREALLTRSVPRARAVPPDHARVADFLQAGATRQTGPLADGEALLLETFVTARRDPEVSAALADASRQWHDAVTPLVEAAEADGTIDPALDPEAVLHLVRVVRLGLLLFRGSGLEAPDPAGWEQLVERIVASFGAVSVATAPAQAGAGETAQAGAGETAPAGAGG